VKAALVEDDPVPQYNATNNSSIIKAGAPAFECTVHLLRLQAPRAAYAHKSPGPVASIKPEPLRAPPGVLEELQ